MVKVVCYLFSLLIISSVFHVEALAKELNPSTIKKVQSATVLLIAYDAGAQETGQGTGFFVTSKGDLVTNWHIINGASSALIKTKNGAIFKVKGILAKNEKRDLVKLAIDAKDINFPFIKLATSALFEGQQIAVIGNPQGLESTVSTGIISAIRDLNDKDRIIQISAPISPGSSGSPVINMDGNVIGVASFQVVKGQNLNFAVPATEIAKLKQSQGAKIIPVGGDSEGSEKEQIASAKINTSVQVKANSWMRIVDEAYKEESMEDFHRRISASCPEWLKGKLMRTVRVTVQFLRPCVASRGMSDDEATSRFLQDPVALMTNEEYFLSFRCADGLKIFCSYFSSKGVEIGTQGSFIRAIDGQKRVISGEKDSTVFVIPEEATQWYVWLSK
jgi:hypothetical protein